MSADGMFTMSRLKLTNNIGIGAALLCALLGSGKSLRQTQRLSGTQGCWALAAPAELAKRR
jgi:hypothetical protein